MIAELKGLLSGKAPNSVVVDVNGVGYDVTISLNTFYKLPEVGGEVHLLVHTAMREDGIFLFGFYDSTEKAVFRKLITVNGIGPKLAINILSGVSAEDLANALNHEDLARLTAIPGIGRKTAERMIVDLKDKLADLAAHDLTSVTTKGREIYKDAVSALMNLGYSKNIAERILAKIPPEAKKNIEVTVKEALKYLSEVR